MPRTLNRTVDAKNPRRRKDQTRRGPVRENHNDGPKRRTPWPNREQHTALPGLILILSAKELASWARALPVGPCPVRRTGDLPSEAPPQTGTQRAKAGRHNRCSIARNAFVHQHLPPRAARFRLRDLRCGKECLKQLMNESYLAPPERPRAAMQRKPPQEDLHHSRNVAPKPLIR